MFKSIKTWYQRASRGYSDEDVWNISGFSIDRLYPLVEKYVRHHETKGRSLPKEFASDPGAWLIVLAKIEYSLHNAWLIKNEPETNPIVNFTTPEGLAEHYKIVEEGFLLLGKHFRDLIGK